MRKLGLTQDSVFHHRLYQEWRKVWRRLLGLSRIKFSALSAESLKVEFSDKALKRFPSPPVLIAIDSSCDSVRSACAALIIKHGDRPWYYAEFGRESDPKNCEFWGIDHAVSAVDRKYGGVPEIVVLTDSIDVVRAGRETSSIEYRLLNRDHYLMTALHVAANILRKKQPVTAEERIRIDKFTDTKRQKEIENLAAKRKGQLDNFAKQSDCRQGEMQRFMDTYSHDPG